MPLMVMANYVLTSKKANALFWQVGLLDVTADATIVGPDRNTLIELQMPNQSLWEPPGFDRLGNHGDVERIGGRSSGWPRQLYRFPA